MTTTFPSMKEIDLINSCLLDQPYKKQYPAGVFIPVDVINFAYNRGISEAKAYKMIVDIVKSIKRDDLEIPLDDETVWHTNLISSYKTNDKERLVSIRWDTEAIALVSGNMIKGTFIQSDKRMGGVSVKKRYVLYELLAEYMYKKSFELRLELIRDRCGVRPDEYKEYKELNRRLIQPTLKDILDYTGIRLICTRLKSTNRVRFTWEERKEEKKDDEITELKKQLNQLKMYGKILDE